MAFESPSHTAASSSSSASGNAKKRKTMSDSSGPFPRVRNPRNSLRPKNSPFADFGSYMVEKNKKLREQFDSAASTSSLQDSGDGKKGIFHGVSIFVDGFTVPSSQELKAYMLKHGGRFENYFSTHTVTHIICSHLPDSKMRNFRAFSRGLPVVKPAWVMDCVAANKLLSWVPYQLEELVNKTSKQQKLSSFFSHKGILSLKNAETPVNQNVKFDAEGSLSKDEGPKDTVLSAEDQVSECRTLGSNVHDKTCEEISTEAKFTDLEDEHSVVQASDTSVHRPSYMDSSSCMYSKNCKEASDIKCARASNQSHSTLTDPNFVENYFRNSRLHFIGTWRNRYRKRFSNMLSEVKGGKANINSDMQKHAIIHIDMDCFFVSVIIRNYPELIDKPVAVCHSDNPKGTAEISSANYPARDYGVRAGMFVRDAKARCPHLVIVPYDFEAYEEVADQFYSILHKHCNKVQALSCDEAFLDVTECGNNNPEQIASMIRMEIAGTTRCTASAGIAENLLLARLATRSAKPNGQCFIPSEKVDDYLNGLPVKALPGIGHALEEKLKSRQVQTCGQLRMVSKEALHKDFGTKIGDMLWNYCRGIDNRMVEVVQETKSIGAEVNWGVRFDGFTDCENFLMNLCKEVSLRLQGCGVQGRAITVKVRKRKKGAEEPLKFMGCGDCETMSRSMTIPVPTDNVVSLQRITKQIFASFHIDVKEIRGIGLQISKLESVDISRQGHEENTLESWLTSSSEKIKTQCKRIPSSVKQDTGEVLVADAECQSKCRNYEHSKSIYTNGTRSCPSEINLGSSRSHENRTSTLPPLCYLDIDVVKSLPQEIISEMNDMYKGELCAFLEKHEEDGRGNAHLSTKSTAEENDTISAASYQRVNCDTSRDMTVGHSDPVKLNSSARNEGKQPLCYPAVSMSNLAFESKVLNPEANEFTAGSMTRTPCKVQSAHASCSRSDDLQMRTTNLIDLMPNSLTQADASVLEQLPEDLKADIIESLPAHRAVNSVGNDPIGFVRAFPNNVGVQNLEYPKTHLWLESPPKWVVMFQTSNCLILNIIAELYTKSRANGLLSSTFQSMFSFLPLTSESCSEEWDETLSSLCELLTQYVNLKIESDIEELYNCFCFLKRCSSMSNLLLEVYSNVLPLLQASVSENYGGILKL
ncbi:DNA repair protein REV1 isoform X2 [Phoenix dactylifera]|uniref:DNA repair protein REV1 n=1 Tax=Phoenix dactylifera TaxID=42345 RepID=A0A8B8ZLH0_PHODC|nr:DNA repair protein REV1 isoform X2 [Phoenix dactylifera]